MKNPRPGLEQFEDCSDGTEDASVDAMALWDEGEERLLDALTLRWNVGRV